MTEILVVIIHIISVSHRGHEQIPQPNYLP